MNHSELSRMAGAVDNSTINIVVVIIIIIIIIIIITVAGYLSSQCDNYSLK